MICFHFSFFFKAHLKLLQTTTCNCLFFYYVFLYSAFQSVKNGDAGDQRAFSFENTVYFSSWERVEELLPTGLNHYSFLYCLTGGLLLPLFSLSSFCHQTDQQLEKKSLSSSSEKKEVK